jgi:hypothetical protein
MIFFKPEGDQQEIARARQNFAGALRRLEPPGTCVTADNLDQLIATLRRGIQQKLTCRIFKLDGTPVGDGPLDVTAPGEQEKWWPRGLEPGIHKLQVQADKTYEQEIDLKRGERFVVRLVESDDGGIDFVRVIGNHQGQTTLQERAVPPASATQPQSDVPPMAPKPSASALLSPSADPIASWELHVYRPLNDGKSWEDLGDALTTPVAIQTQDRLKLKAAFRQPVFPAVLAINPDGTVQRLKGVKDDRPDRMSRELTVPPDTDRYIKLIDPGPTGFVIVVSPQPLSDPDRMVAGAVDVPGWRASRPELACIFDGHQVAPVVRRRVAEESVGPKPFSALCEKLQSRAGITAVRAVVFGVQPR